MKTTDSFQSGSLWRHGSYRQQPPVSSAAVGVHNRVAPAVRCPRCLHLRSVPLRRRPDVVEQVHRGKNVWTRNGRWRPRKRQREHHRAAPVSFGLSPVTIDNKILSVAGGRLQVLFAGLLVLLSLYCRLPVGVLSLCAGRLPSFDVLLVSARAAADRSPPPRSRSPAWPIQA